MKKSTKTPSPAVRSKISPATAPVATGRDLRQTPASTLSDDQMQQLAQSFHDISVAIGQIRLELH